MSKIQIKGLDRVMKDFNKAPDLITQGIANLISGVGSKIEAEMAKEAPNDRGALRNSIKKRVTKTKNGLRLTVGPNVAYALDLHTGTKRLAGHADMGKRGISRVRSYWLDKFKGDRKAMTEAFSHMSIAPNRFVDRTAEMVEKGVDEYVEKSIAELISKI